MNANDHQTITCRQKIAKVPKKRWCLPLMGIFALLSFEEWRDVIHMPIVVTFGSIIFFWNFPALMYYKNSKPMYYEDIFIDEEKLPNYNVNDKIKAKFEFILQWAFIFTNSLLAGALSEYWLLKTTDLHNYVEILGISGGILKIFQTLTNILGSILLQVFKKCISKENETYKIKQQQQQQQQQQPAHNITRTRNNHFQIDRPPRKMTI